MKQSAFSISNCWQTLKWMLLTNKRQLSVRAIGMAIGAFIVGEYIVGRSHITIGDTDNYNVMSATLPFLFGFAYALWMLYGASQTFAFMKTKQSAIAYMMHPSSSAEMFVARLTYVSVAWAVIGGVGMIVGDCARWLLDTIMGTNAPMAIVHIWHYTAYVLDELPKGKEMSIAFDVMATGGLYSLWIYTLYILGSAVFRRHRILFTTIAVTLIHMFFVGSFFIDPNSTPFMAVVLLAVLCVANVTAAYALFKRMQVINNKWLNI